MKILIAYGTKYGCCEKCAKILSEKLNGTVDLFNLKKDENINLNEYDLVIVGGSIYAGKIRNEVMNFCRSNLDILKHKKQLFLYVV
nr:flavodoxin domain-containing protein [Fervidicella metallireducens]